MLTHTNNCVARSAVDTLSRMESFPDIIGTISIEEARVLYRSRTCNYHAMNNSIWFETDGVAYQVADGKCHIMSFYNNSLRKRT